MTTDVEIQILRGLAASISCPLGPAFSHSRTIREVSESKAS